MTSIDHRLALPLAVGFVAGLVCSALFIHESHSALAQSPAAIVAAPSATAELETIKGKLPDQSHAMQDVGYHFTNLWFAAQQQNWDLANFYWSETKSHLHWAVRIIPVRKDNAGVEIKLADILQAMENGPLKQLGDAIAAKDPAAFEAAYRFSLENCYACHKAADKPFLHPQIPTAPAATILNFDPHATWPR